MSEPSIPPPDAPDAGAVAAQAEDSARVMKHRRALRDVMAIVVGHGNIFVESMHCTLGEVGQRATTSPRFGPPEGLNFLRALKRKTMPFGPKNSQYEQHAIHRRQLAVRYCTRFAPEESSGQKCKNR